MRGFSRIVLPAALIALLFLALASLRRSAPPTLIVPADGAAAAVGTEVPPYQFRWRHGIHVYRQPIVWRRANYFVICLAEYQAGDFECEYPGGSSGPPWGRAAADIPSATGAPASRFEDAIRVYTFTADTFPSGLLDKDLMWTVGACASQNTDSCSFGVPPHRFRITGRNLIAANVSESYLGSTRVGARYFFDSDGANSTGPFQYNWQAIQLVPNPSNDPRTDVDSADFDQNVDRVLLSSNGTVVPINSLPRIGGAYDISDVRGILVRNGYEDSGTQTHPGLARIDTGFLDKTFNVAGTTVIAGQPTLLAFVLIMDPSNTMPETDESDNVHIKDKSYIFP